MNKYNKIEECFNINGNFIIPGFDPYRYKGDEKDLYDFLFDEDGYAKRIEDTIKLIHQNKWSWDCDAVKYYYAGECIDANCKGNYTAVYAWRH